ncbi:MAG: hypothetical protein JJD93_02505 [Ilumatobacteraceae bacterium]|nr:hypothetical protein [Ilumatobacteraceae bacterium]
MTRDSVTNDGAAVVVVDVVVEAAVVEVVVDGGAEVVVLEVVVDCVGDEVGAADVTITVEA